ncbi:MAG: hypothetical protein MK211_12105 [Flavobacteriales bacterium]|uniref:hypothetical protein n=1 Tax=Candidatus Ulvibacter alkanivorans TaxID=2267620 RepID=UPI000DF3BAAB|nr:hypothetical protein [Candidatus Ulvibacter alkanivorans]MCH2490883.1 hypothetical protein [Flavobacteriales bacterium]
MKTAPIALLLFCALFLINCGANKDSTQQNIFRYIDLYRFGKIELGDELSNLQHLTIGKDNRYFLKDNVFGGAETIELIPDRAGKLTHLIFAYGPGINTDSLIKEYKYLGAYKNKNGSAVWKDQFTRFEIYTQSENSRLHTFSKLTDLQGKE